MVGVLEEAGVHLHLAREHRLEVVRHVVPGRDLLRPLGQLGLRRDHAELLLACEGLLAERVPARVEAALVLVRPLERHVVRRVRGARREVGEERLVRHQRLLLADPVDRAVGHVLREVVALLRGPVRLDRRRAVVERRRVLVRLAADEPVEVLEAAAATGPGVERPQWARLPHRDLVALAELRGRVAVQLERLRQRRRGVRANRVVARRGRGDLRDSAHADGVVVASCQQRLACRRAQRGRVEAVVLQPVRGQSLRHRGRARTPERARRAEADVVEQHDQHVRRTLRRTQRLDRREGSVGILRVVGDQALMRRGRASAGRRAASKLQSNVERTLATRGVAVHHLFRVKSAHCESRTQRNPVFPVAESGVSELRAATR